MKVNAEPTKVTFQPKTLSIVFESQEELNLFVTMFQADCRIPDWLLNYGSLSRDRSIHLGNMMTEIHNKLSQL